MTLHATIAHTAHITPSLPPTSLVTKTFIAPAGATQATSTHYAHGLSTVLTPLTLCDRLAHRALAHRWCVTI